MVPALRPAYLIAGEDHSAVRERRLRLAQLVGRSGGEIVLEIYEGPAATPKQAATALSTLPIGGWRILVFDGAERWKGKDVVAHLAPFASRFPPQTTLACFAYEEGRRKVCPELVAAVRESGGVVETEPILRGSRLLNWARREATRRGAKLSEERLVELCERFGSRRARLLRELERLALAGEAAEEGWDRTSGASPFALVDAILAGDRSETAALALALLRQGERPHGLIHLLAGRLRTVQEAAAHLAEGRPERVVRGELRLPPRPAQLVLDAAKRLGPDRTGAGLALLADLEAELHSAPVLAGSRLRRPVSGEETAFLRGCLRLASLFG